jgi:hypothetical protein
LPLPSGKKGWFRIGVGKIDADLPILPEIISEKDPLELLAVLEIDLLHLAGIVFQHLKMAFHLFQES